MINIKIEAPTTETKMVPKRLSAEIPNNENTNAPINEPIIPIIIFTKSPEPLPIISPAIQPTNAPIANEIKISTIILIFWVIKLNKIFVRRF